MAVEENFLERLEVGGVGSDSVVNDTVTIGSGEEASVLIPENEVEAW